jgi:hypothetical protein
MGPQAESMYSLASGDSGIGVRPGAGSGAGLSYGGRRAGAALDDSSPHARISLTPDMDADVVQNLRENLGLPNPAPDENWVLAAGQYGRGFDGYGPASPVLRAPMSRDEFRRKEIKQMNAAGASQDDLVAPSSSVSISASPGWMDRMSSLAGAAWNGKISWGDAAAWAWSDQGRTRANGLLQGVGGTVEASIGAGLSLGPLAPVGVAMTIHGADNAAAGFETAGLGVRQSTGLVEGLKYVGMDANNAEFVNSGLGFLGGVAAFGPASSSLGLRPISAHAARLRPASAEISTVGRGYGGNMVVDRIAGEAQGALSQANRILEAGDFNSAWGAIYQRIRGTDSKLEFFARRNALHQEAEGLLLNNRYIVEAMDQGYIVEFNLGSRLGVRSSNGALLRPDIQIQAPTRKFGVLDFTTPGSAPKIFKYGPAQQAPYLINITIP